VCETYKRKQNKMFEKTYPMIKMNHKKHSEKSYEVINIWDFPPNMYVKLPKNYRALFFQLAFSAFKNSANLQKHLQQKKLPTNVIRWRNGYEKNSLQLTNLDVLLYLQPHVRNKMNFVWKLYKSHEKCIGSKPRVTKSQSLKLFIKEMSLLFPSKAHFADTLQISLQQLNYHMNNKQTISIPSNIVQKILNIAYKYLKNLTFSKEEIQAKVVSYKTYHGKEIMPVFKKQKKLPIKVTPEFESLIYHLYADGHVSKIGSSEYTQIPLEGKTNFLRKLFNVFGFFHHSKSGFSKGRVYVSKTIIKILCHYYNLKPENFLWNKSRIPEICMNRVNAFKVAGLLSFIVDEGHVGHSNITIHSSNLVLLKQIHSLTLDIGVECFEIRLKKGRGTTKDSFRFNIAKSGVRKLFLKANDVEKEFSTCNFAQKSQKIKDILT
jgi:hypothetical protein